MELLETRGEATEVLNAAVDRLSTTMTEACPEDLFFESSLAELWYAYESHGGGSGRYSSSHHNWVKSLLQVEGGEADDENAVSAVVLTATTLAAALRVQAGHGFYLQEQDNKKCASSASSSLAVDASLKAFQTAGS